MTKQRRVHQYWFIPHQLMHQVRFLYWEHQASDFLLVWCLNWWSFVRRFSSEYRISDKLNKVCMVYLLYCSKSWSSCQKRGELLSSKYFLHGAGRDETKFGTNLNNPESAQYRCIERGPQLLNQACDSESLKCQHQNLPAADDSPSHSKSRHLRQVIMQYGLEYGPPTGPRLTIQHGLLQKHGRSKIIRLAGAAVMGVAGLICLGAATHNLAQGNHTSLRSIKSVMGRKLMSICEDTSRIWWLKDSGTILGYALWFCYRALFFLLWWNVHCFTWILFATSLVMLLAFPAGPILEFIDVVVSSAVCCSWTAGSVCMKQF